MLGGIRALACGAHRACAEDACSDKQGTTRLRCSLAVACARTWGVEGEQVEHVPLLVVKDIAGKFRGHQHPVSQLYQDKALRKGVAPNHYVVEGAKRIHIKHVPAHCPGIHIPQWCLEDAEGCLARLPHLLSTGDARGLI